MTRERGVRTPQGPVACLVAVRVVQHFEVVQVPHRQREGRSTPQAFLSLILKRAAIQESCERVGCSLEVRLLHHPEHSESGAAVVGEGYESPDLVLGCRSLDGGCRVQHANTSPCHTDGHAHRRADANFAAFEVRAGVDRVA